MSAFPCAHCGEMIPEDATFCKHCGSDHETGWNPDVDYYSVDLPEQHGDEAREPSPVAKGARLVLVAVLVIILSVACVADIGGVSRYAVGVLFFGWLMFVVFKRQDR